LSSCSFGHSMSMVTCSWKCQWLLRKQSNHYCQEPLVGLLSLSYENINHSLSWTYSHSSGEKGETWISIVWLVCIRHLWVLKISWKSKIWTVLFMLGIHFQIVWTFCFCRIFLYAYISYVRISDSFKFLTSNLVLFLQKVYRLTSSVSEIFLQLAKGTRIPLLSHHQQR